MSQVNVTIDGQALVSPVTQQSIVVVAPPSGAPQLSIVTAGPAISTGGTFAALADVDASDKANKSVIYYDSSSGKYKADSTETLITISDGGNF